MLRFILLVFFYLLFNAIYAQEESGFFNDHHGTYQFQMINTRGYPFIPSNLDEIIRKNRKENETVYLELGTLVTLKILSYSEIKKEGFVPIEKIVYLSEKEHAGR